MLNYGGSITSAFPNTFCSSPASLTCQLCNTNINEGSISGSSSALGVASASAASGMAGGLGAGGPGPGMSSSSNAGGISVGGNSSTGGHKLEKCIHCGINICERCFNENHECPLSEHPGGEPGEKHKTNMAHTHYNTVKKEFKQMYNYSKEIVEKLHLLNNTIKLEESAVSELNLIKHQVNTKAIELIKQINQEKSDLIEQIENVKRKYESTLNDRKEYYALSMQYKDELRKVIRKYKEFKSEERCSLNDVLKLYFSVKTISKSLDDYDHIKLITEQDPLQVKFEERPIYRNLIGKLLLNNHKPSAMDLLMEDKSGSTSTRGTTRFTSDMSELHSAKTITSTASKGGLSATNGSKSGHHHHHHHHHHHTVKEKNKTAKGINGTQIPVQMINGCKQKNIDILNEIVKMGGVNGTKDMSRSFSLNDLIDSNEAPPVAVANPGANSNSGQVYNNSTSNSNGNPVTNLIKTKTVNKSSPILNDNNEPNLTELNNFMLMATQSINKKQHQQHQQQQQLLQFIQAKVMNSGNLLSPNKLNGLDLPPPPPPPISQSFLNDNNPQQQNGVENTNGNQTTLTSQTQSATLKPKNVPNLVDLSDSSSSASSAPSEKSPLPNGVAPENTPVANSYKTGLPASLNPNINGLNSKFVEQYREKQAPKQRLEIDILPSYLNSSKNKLLIASSFGKIRVVDLFSYKIQKDELKNLLINGICIPRKKNADGENEILYAVTNGEMNEKDDLLNVSNSTIIVTRRELKVLKKEDNNMNDDYVFLNPSGVCYDDYDNLYICDSGYNRVKVLDRNLTLLSVIETASNESDRLASPKSVTTHGNTLFVCDSANHRIVSYSILDEGRQFKFKSVYGSGYGDEPGMLKYPLECCVDSFGCLFVRDHHNNRVQIFATDATSISGTDKPLHYIEVNSQRETIYSMTVTENGDVYVAKMVHLQEQDHSGLINTINKYYIDIY